MGDIIMGDGYLFLSYTACNLVAVIWLVRLNFFNINRNQEKQITHRL